MATKSKTKFAKLGSLKAPRLGDLKSVEKELLKVRILEVAGKIARIFFAALFVALILFVFLKYYSQEKLGALYIGGIAIALYLFLILIFIFYKKLSSRARKKKPEPEPKPTKRKPFQFEIAFVILFGVGAILTVFYSIMKDFLLLSLSAILILFSVIGWIIISRSKKERRPKLKPKIKPKVKPEAKPEPKPKPEEKPKEKPKPKLRFRIPFRKKPEEKPSEAKLVREAKVTGLKIRKLGKEKTQLDILHDLLIEKKKLKVGEIAKIFKVSEEIAEEWCKLFQIRGLAELYYPAFGDAVLQLIEKPSKVEKKKGKKEEKEEEKEESKEKELEKEKHKKESS